MRNSRTVSDAEHLVELVMSSEPIVDFDGIGRKEAFHRLAIRVLRAVAQQLPGDVRSNRGGPAVGGEVTLTSEKLYVQMSADLREYGVLYRAPGSGVNRWMPWRKLLDLPSAVAELRGVT